MLPQSKIDKLMEQAKFVFSGTVQAVKEATLPDIDTKNTLIVQVDAIHETPEMFQSLTGQKITVKFDRLPKLNVGDSRIFYTNGWIFGQTIGVTALRIDTEAVVLGSNPTNKVMQAKNNVLDKNLKKRLDSADLAVSGWISKTAQAAIKPDFISEHNPDWHEATIEVESVEKGDKKTKQVKVLFPQSDDVRWYNVRKYSEGEEGIWLLQKGKEQSAEGIQAKVFGSIPEGNTYTTIHPLDCLPISDLDKVKKLLKK